MSELKSYLQQVTETINRDSGRMDLVREWIGDGYYGKVISFAAPDENYHIVLIREGVELREGDYPSCEFSYRGNREVLINLLNRKTSAYTGVKGGQLMVWGSLSEALAFEKLL